MSQPTQPPFQPPPQPQPLPQYVPTKRKRAWLPYLITAVVALGIGGAVGGAGDSATVATPAPAVTVTATPKPAPTKTVAKEVAEVPKACLKALDDADAGFGIAADMLGVFQATIEIVVDGLSSGDYDVDGINEQTDKLNNLTDRLTIVGDRYNDAKAECRAAAE